MPRQRGEGGEPKFNRERELKSKNIDAIFKDTFEQKLASTPELSEAEGRRVAWFYNIKGVERVRREIPAVLVPVDKEGTYDFKFVIWTGSRDFRSKGDGFVHADLDDDLSSFCEEKKIDTDSFARMSSYLVEDEKGKKYLFFDSTMSEWVSGEERSAKDWKRLEEMAEEYGIENFVKSFRDGQKEVKTFAWSVVERKRIDNYILAMAEKYEMTNSEFLRLRTIYLAAIEGREKEPKRGDKNYKKREGYVVPPFDIEAVAREIVAEREES